MADNVTINTLTGSPAAAADEVTYSGDVANVQLMRPVLVTGTEGSKTVVELTGDATNGLDVDVTRLPALPAGTNNIGDVDVLTLPSLPAGTNNIGDVDVLTLPALPTGANTIGSVAAITTSVTPGTAAANLGKAEDAVHASGDVGVMALAVRQDTLATLASATGDYEPLHLDSSGRLYTQAQGPAAHDAAISGNPVRIAGRALTSDYAAVAAGDVADLITSLLGKQVMLPLALPGQTWSYAAAAGGLVNTTGVTARAAQAAGIRNYVSSIQVTNSNQTVGTEVVVRDGAAGTVLHRGWAPPNGGYAHTFEPPLRGTAATLIEIAEITATPTAGVLVNLQGFSAAE